MTDNSGLSYLTIPSLSPGHIIRPSSMFLQPNISGADSLEATLDVQWANVSCYEPGQYRIDGEWIRSNVRIQYGVSDPLSAGILVPFMERSGGFADPYIEDFHKTVHLGDTMRSQLPKNQDTSWVISNSSTQNLVRGDSFGLGDVALYAVLKRPGTTYLPSVTLQFQLTLPTGDEDQLEGLGSSSVSVSAVTSKRLGNSPIIVFGGGGIFYCPNDELVGIPLYREEYSLLAGVEYEYTPSLSFVVQNLSSSALAKDCFELSKSSDELGVGLKWKTRTASILEFAFIHNLFEFKNSADITFHLSFTQPL